MTIRHSAIAAALALGAAVFTAPTAEAQINLTPGDIALIGWVDNGAPADILTIVNFVALPAGTTLYLTDNGWTGSDYRNTQGPTDGDGNEQLLQFVVNNPIPAGTIISTTDTSADFTWSVGAPIVGAMGSFAIPALAQAGDQVSVFQHDTGMNPMNTAVQMHLFLLDDTGTLEAASTSNEGDAATGLSIAGNTAVTFAQNSSGQNFMAFNQSTLLTGSKSDWLAAIANGANWTFGSSGTLPSGTISVSGTGGPGFAFCFGDGSGVACPCANSGSAGNGCANSINAAGGNLSATGTPSLTNDQLVLLGTGMPNSSALYFQGTSQQAGGAGIVFGDGLRCAAGSIIRLGTKNNSGGGSQYPAMSDPSVSVRGLVTVPGTRVYQCWYRNAAVFCSVSTFNLTNGWEVAWSM